VLGAHLERTGGAVLPRAEQEGERAAALRQAHVLPGRELVRGRRHERAARQPPAGGVPRERVAEDGATEVEGPVGDQPGGRPRHEIPGSERRRRERPPPASHARVQRHGRRDRREHHRRHHHDPHAEEPADGPERGAWAGVHALHPVRRRPPGDPREPEERGDQPEPGARGGERGPEAGLAGDRARGRDAGGGHVRRPTRSATSRSRTSPRTRCRRR
jgi:hypothetical protein